MRENDALERAVVTGCLRISKESIFTGLNHLEISLIYDNGFEESFGFTQSEVDQMLTDYGIPESYVSSTQNPSTSNWFQLRYHALYR